MPSKQQKRKKMPCPLPVLDPCRIGGGFIQCDKEWGFSSLFSVVGFGHGVSASLDISLPPLRPSLRIHVTPQ